MKDYEGPLETNKLIYFTGIVAFTPRLKITSSISGTSDRLIRESVIEEAKFNEFLHSYKCIYKTIKKTTFWYQKSPTLISLVV